MASFHRVQIPARKLRCTAPQGAGELGICSWGYEYLTNSNHSCRGLSQLKRGLSPWWHPQKWNHPWWDKISMNSPASLMVTWPNQVWSGHVWLVLTQMCFLNWLPGKIWNDCWLGHPHSSWGWNINPLARCTDIHIYIYICTLRLQKKEPCLLKSTHGIRGRVLKKRCPTIWACLKELKVWNLSL